jgi:hypothetical protein
LGGGGGEGVEGWSISEGELSFFKGKIFVFEEKPLITNATKKRFFVSVAIREK